MYSLGLLGAKSADATEVVAHLAAVQSQDFGSAKWSLGDRATGVSDAAVTTSFNEGDFLRTHILRPTWHFVTPADIVWMLELTAPRVLKASARQLRELELDQRLLRRSQGILVGALAGGNHLTRKEVTQLLGEHGIDARSRRLGYILMVAELEGLICSGVMKGKEQTHALLDERAPEATRFSQDVALAELVLRYFTSHGPATVKDLGWWASLTLTTVRESLAQAGDGLRSRTALAGSVLVRDRTPP